MEGNDGTWMVTGCDHKLPTSLCMHQDASLKPPASFMCSMFLILFDSLYSYSSPTYLY